MEGLALHAVRQLAPEVPDHMRLSVAPERYRDWVNECEDALPTVIESLRSVLSADDEVQYGRFFYPDWLRSIPDVPERVGYLIGERLVEQLHARYSLEARPGSRSTKLSRYSEKPSARCRKSRARHPTRAVRGRA